MNIFVSYGHSDERWVKEGVERELIPWLKRQLQLDDVTIWADPRLSEHPSRKFREEIEREIDRAHIAILLISEDFTSSVFITTVELPRIKARIERGEMLLVAIQVGPMTKHGKKKIPWIYERQVLPSETKPLIDCVKDDAEFEYTRIQILEAIRNTLEDIRQRPSVTTPAESTAIYDSQLSSATSSNGSVLLDQGKVDDVASAVNRPIPEPSSVTSEPSSPVQGKREKGVQAHLYSCLVWMGKHHLVTVAAVTVLVLIAVAGIFYYDRVTDKGGDVPAADRVVSQTGEAVIEHPAPAEAVVEETIVPEVGHDFLESAFVWCPPGQFLCGDKWDAETIARKYGESAKWYKDAPQYTASITEGFWIAAKETTVSEFEAFVKETKYKTDAEKSGKGRVLNLLNEKWEEQPDANWRQPGWTITSEQPVVLVSWNDAIAYCQWLSQKTGETYRLPMEKEWEYACRAGTDTEFWWGDEIAKGQKYINAADETNSPGGKNEWSSKFPFASGFFYVAPVGRFLPNKWGLYDMHGNVYEWCYDKYYKYPSDNTDSPSGLTTAKSDRVSRGGSWRCGPGFCRSAFRNHGPEDSADSFTGFRIVRASSSPRTEPESKPITSKPESGHEAATPNSQKDTAPVPIPSDDVDVPPEVREAVMKAIQEMDIKGNYPSWGSLPSIVEGNAQYVWLKMHAICQGKEVPLVLQHLHFASEKGANRGTEAWDKVMRFLTLLRYSLRTLEGKMYASEALIVLCPYCGNSEQLIQQRAMEIFSELSVTDDHKLDCLLNLFPRLTDSAASRVVSNLPSASSTEDKERIRITLLDFMQNSNLISGIINKLADVIEPNTQESTRQKLISGLYVKELKNIPKEYIQLITELTPEHEEAIMSKVFLDILVRDKSGYATSSIDLALLNAIEKWQFESSIPSLREKMNNTQNSMQAARIASLLAVWEDKDSVIPIRQALDRFQVVQKNLAPDASGVAFATLIIALYFLEESNCAGFLSQTFLSASPELQKYLLTMCDMSQTYSYQMLTDGAFEIIPYKKFQDIKEPTLIDAVQKLRDTTTDTDLKKAAEAYLAQMQ